MSQVTEYKVPGSPLTMAILKTALDNMFAALADCNRGASAPSNPTEGMLWWDTSGTPTELLKRFTAVAGWVTLLSVNVTTGVVIPYRAGSPLGTMAAETATDYVAKSLFNAQTFLAAVDDNTPVPVSVAQNRILGRKTGNIAALTLTDVLDMIGSAAEGDILYRGADGWVRLPKGSAGQGLRMNSYATSPEWGALDESALSLSDVTTGNVSTSKHGFVPKAPNDTSKFLRGDGSWTAEIVADGAITAAKLSNVSASDDVCFVSPYGFKSVRNPFVYTKASDLTVRRNGTMRLKFTIKTLRIAVFSIRKNNVQIEETQLADYAAPSGIVITRDISVSRYNTIQIYVKCTHNHDISVSNIYLCHDGGIEATNTVT